MTRNSCHIAVIAAVLALHFIPHSINKAVANDEANSATLEFDARERELRRKEEELLRAMDLNSAETTSAQSIEVANPRTESLGSKSLDSKSLGSEALDSDNSQVQVLEIKAPEPKVEAALPSVEKVSTEAPQLTNQQHPALKELAHHPALEPPRKIAAPPLVATNLATTNRIRTKTSEDAPDGTTAKRLGSFYRIDRSDVDSERRRGIPHSQTVPIQQYSTKEPVRPALLTSDELATIQNASTYLKTGPTRLDSTLLRVPQYAEVRIDYRSGDWYRVKTTGGLRGWVPGSSLLFDADTQPQSTVRIGAVTKQLQRP